MIFRHTVLASILFSLVGSAYTTVRQPRELFDKWMQIQYTVQDQSIQNLTSTVNDDYLARMYKNYSENIPLFRSIHPLLTNITAGMIQPNSCDFSPPISDEMLQNINALFLMFDVNIDAFINYLKELGFQDFSEQTEPGNNIRLIIEKYNSLIKLLFSTQSPRQHEELGIALANRLIEFCYSPRTFPAYQETLLQAEYFSIARMIHSIIWFNIIGNGWKLWHADCLKNLKAEADAGKRIKYIAGGNDIYTLLCNGIYNTTIIDPFLPSQAQYYAQGWEWLLKGELQDEIIGVFGTQELRLERTEQIEGDSFLAKSGDQFVSLKKFITTWTVFDAPSNSCLGTIVFDRRPVSQNDLVPTLQEVFLMSYDEFIYLGLPSLLNGWGIQYNQIDPAFIAYIKQLRRPVNRDFLNNLHIAAIANYADLKFIQLVSDAN